MAGVDTNGKQFKLNKAEGAFSGCGIHFGDMHTQQESHRATK